MLSQVCIKVCDDFGEEELEVPLEDDRTLLLTTLQSIFPGSTGLKFRNINSGCYRVIRRDPERFYPPQTATAEADGWDCEKTTYICVFPKAVNESKNEDWASETSEKEKEKPSPVVVEEKEKSAAAQPKTVDLIILNLSPSTTEADLRKYFESKYGPLVMAELKRDRTTGSSRRFAFIRFEKYKDQMKALGHVKHKIDNQQVRVALPDYRDPSELYQENKCFIGRVNEAIKANDLKVFFSQFGEIVEVSYPKKFKGYAFVTFSDPEVAARLCGSDFVIQGYSVCVSKSTNGNSNSKASPVTPMNQRGGYCQSGGYGQSGYGQSDWKNGGSNWYTGDSWGSGQQYVTAPLNPSMNTQRNSNFYGHSAALSQMGNSLLSANVQNVSPLNMLSMAMGNLLSNSMNSSSGMQNQNYRDRTQASGTLWHPRNNDNQPKTKKKQKKPKNKPKSKSTAETAETVEDEAVDESPKDDSKDEPAAVVESVEVVTEE